MRKLLESIIPTLILFTLFTSACDSAKPQREALLKNIEQLDAEVVRLNNQRDEAQRAIETLSTEIQHLNDGLEQHSQRRTKLQDELAVFLLDHKMATAALIAAGGGAATFLKENIDEDTKTALRLVGAAGFLYCLGNSSECADVTARVAYYGSQIASENKEIAARTSGRSSAESALQARKKQHASVSDAITEKQTERNYLKKKHDSMVCRFCI